jgi:23S rRNA (uracil1939-C5)-methyltransferase
LTNIEQKELTIEKLVYGGDGLARADGRVVLTPFVLPGETVHAEISRAKNDLLRGHVTKVMERSSERVEPGCPYFYRCGGCQYQHIGYERQLKEKTGILREVLRRVGKIDYQGDIEVIAGPPWEYRNRAQLHIDRGAIGYFEAASHKLCPIDRCPISSPRINDAIAQLARELPRYRPFTAGVELFTNESELQVNLPDRVPASTLPLFQNVGTRDPIMYGQFRVSRGSFFQVNRFLVEKLVDAAIGGALGETALDLYAGVGLFAARLITAFQRVYAIEPGGNAYRDLEFNIKGAVSIEKRTAENYLAGTDTAPDLIVADPPRAGLGKAVVGELIRLRGPAVTIVSCDPATLARDLAGLLAANYRIDRMTLVDLFPQTYHMETVIRLRHG